MISRSTIITAVAAAALGGLLALVYIGYRAAGAFRPLRNPDDNEGDTVGRPEDYEPEPISERDVADFLLAKARESGIAGLSLSVTRPASGALWYYASARVHGRQFAACGDTVDDALDQLRNQIRNA